MLTKLVRPIVGSAWNQVQLTSVRGLSASNVLFKESSSKRSTDAKGQGSNSKTQATYQGEQSGKKKTTGAQSDTEQERSQQEGPADRAAEQKSSQTDSSTKQRPKN